MAETNDILYIGGNFSQVGPVTGAFGAVDQVTAAVQTPYSLVNGTVKCAIPDGSGGFFIGGAFTSVGNMYITNLAHLGANLAVDTNFVFNVNGPVSALAISTQQLFIGGSFSAINGVSMSSLGSITLTNGQLSSFPLSVNGSVATLIVSGNTLYMGGTFTQVGTSNQAYVAAVDLTSGQLNGWSPALNSSFGLGVSQVLMDGNTLYVAGDFSEINGTTRSAAAAFDADNGLLLPWDPQASAPYTIPLVNTLAVSSNAVFLAGGFTTLQGQARARIGAVDKASGAPLAWNPGIPANEAYVLTVSGNTLYMGGDFTGIGTNGPGLLAAVDATSGIPESWNPAPGGTVYCLIASNGLVYAGGNFSSVGGVARNLVAAIDLNTGTATDWNPNFQGTYVSALAFGTNSIYIGGHFYEVGSSFQNAVCAVNLQDASLLPFNTGIAPNWSVWGIVLAGTNLVLTGVLPTGLPTVVDPITGNSTTWNFGNNGSINCFAVNGNTLYVGGSFTNISNQARSNLAAYDATSRALLPWAPVVNNSVSKLLVHDNDIIAVGDFSTANGKPRANIAVFDNSTAQLVLGPTSLFLGGGSLQSMAASSNALYLAGGFNSVNGANSAYFAAVGLLDGQTQPWNPGAISTNDITPQGWAILAEPHSVIAGGTMSSFGILPINGDAVFAITNPAPFVQVESPADFSSLAAGTTNLLAVQASSPNTIEHVDVYMGTNLLTAISNAPYQISWVVPKPIGTYVLKAVAYDEYGEDGLSASVRVNSILPSDYVPPTLGITWPQNQATYPPNSTINVQTEISTPKSTVQSVQFFLNSNTVSTVTNPPFQTTFTNMAAGAYYLSAQLVDDYGVTVSNGPVKFTINAAPTISFNTPRNGQIFPSNTNIAFSVSASDANDTVTSVAYFNGTNLLNVATNGGSFQWTWTNLLPGYFSLTAIASNSFGSSTISSPVNITIYPGPSVSLILDNTNTNVTFSGSWTTNTTSPGKYGPNYCVATCTSNSSSPALATYTPVIPTSGLYDVFVWNPFGSSTNAQWSITYNGGITNVSLNQTSHWGSWFLIGSRLNFGAGTNGNATLSSNTGEGTNRYVIADAVMFASSTPPFITNQPSSRSISRGATTSFQVGASGSPPLIYQWLFNSTNLSGATNSSLTISNAYTSQAGAYSVLVSNPIGSAASSNAMLNVTLARPRILVGSGTPSLSSNGLSMQITGLLGDGPVIVFASSNLITWQPIFTNGPVSGTMSFIDPAATNFSFRYYKVLER